MIHNIKKITLAMTLMATTAIGAQAQELTGRVIGTDGKPIADVMVSSPGCKIARTDADGKFSFSGLKDDAAVTFKHEGFYNKVEHVKKNEQGNTLTVHMIPTTTSRYTENVVTVDGTEVSNEANLTLNSVSRKDFALGTNKVEETMRSLPGLQVTNKSGMTGEGAYIQLRGVKSLVASNNPLFVINGVPYVPDMNESQVINGYSRSVFEALHGQDIKNVTILKGGEAAIYGSMASNGVILIETDQASKENMNTRISFNAQYGFNWSSNSIPLMNSTQYKSYLTDMGLTYYANQESFFNDFTFLSNPSANNAELYSYDTDWQDLISKNSTSQDYMVRVEGGDNIAKYNISLGYNGEDGVLKNTGTDNYHAQINASVLVSRKFEVLASVNTAYLKGTYMEQGMSEETNPLLAAYRRSPLLSPFRSDIYGKLISTYSKYEYGAIDNKDMYVSNPLAIVNTVDARQKQYDLNGKIQLVYRPTNDVTINGTVGMYYNYNQENVFIPGVTDEAIKYIEDEHGVAYNTVRVATNYTFNMFYGLNAVYQKVFNEKHAFKGSIGFQATTTSYEYDASYGGNTASDFYKTMGDVTTTDYQKYFGGYNDKWNWADYYLHMDYTYNNLLKLGLTASVDVASSFAPTFGHSDFYPGFDVTLMLKQLSFFKKIDFINKLNVYTNLSITGNSRYNSKKSFSYYTSNPFLTIAGIVPANLATSDYLDTEKDNNINVGIETSFWNNRVSLGAEFYSTLAKNVIVPGNNMSAVLGTSSYYLNNAEITARGVEVKLNVIPLMMKNFTWSIGGTMATLRNKVTKLANDITYTLSDDATLITRQGEDPYSFYGYQSVGVFSTTAEANAAALVNDKGVAYEAGDVHFVDQNGDGVINDEDKVILGSASPKLYGSFYTRFEYKQFALDLNFGYQTGGKAYNAVRRITESAMDFSNQSTAVLRRWSMEGQITDIPRAEYGDPRGNNSFSDRWIESTNFLKLRDITLSYTHNKPILNFIQSATVYVSGQNLFTITNYLGLDPEFSYSYSTMMQGVDYGKTSAPRSFKIGVNLKF